ncbi:DNA glycosylase [Dactylonectria macrodidyma]|uniref:Adenine DNA glycosylase n=1 Tax=Dactylonectria macrodidyma TaxID=307937 RepID=A0A9P9F8K0_9HYPO|nr:DNA glycosylase [Dactylonectria macrodidyma]
MAALSSRATRSSASAASKKISSQFKTDGDSPEPTAKAVKRRPASHRDASESDASAHEESDEPAPKRQKSQPSRAKSKGEAAQLHQRLFGPPDRIAHQHQPCVPPTRRHGAGYHRPALLDDAASRDALLTWFDGVSTKRKMPWRKAWIDPREHANAAQLRKLLERRAYEVWISEIMLQQTRVAVVIDYWNNWMAKWETIHDLAAASPEDVLSAWRGLGYYSRATRIHEAAKLVVQDPDMMGLLPSRVEQLEAKVPGVGRYTAGAISAIVFGRAVPMVDGNVLRVLSRQLGLLGNVKTDKLVIDTLWAAAAALAKAVARDGPEETTEDDVSNRPGRWGQALMELGSTVCTPKPNCDQCPISSTCRAYEEGKTLVSSAQKPKMEDIEDLCHLCEPLEETPGLEEDENAKVKTKPAPKENKQGKQMKLSAFMFKSPAGDKERAKPKTGLSTKDLEVIVDHARKFPLKVVKKAVRVEETLVCVIRRSDGQYLIQKRPEKGLLAGLWEFPSQILQESDDNSTAKLRRTRATAFVSDLIARDKMAERALKHVRELDSVPWLFSHIKLTMHVHLFTLDVDDDRVKDTLAKPSARQRWASPGDVDKESMGTGMRKCWELAKDSD